METYLTKLYKSSFLSVDNFSNASTSDTTIKLFFALVTATLVISELFFYAVFAKEILGSFLLSSTKRSNNSSIS